MNRMTFFDHLTDLRKILIRIVVIIFGGFIASYYWGQEISEILLAPLRQALQGSGKIVYIGILDKVLSLFQVSFWASLIITSPLWFYQIWSFIKPGLFERERAVLRSFMIAGFILFLLGICFGYFIVFPIAFKILLHFGVNDVEAMMGLKEYLSLSLKVLVVLGFVFQLPSVIIILAILKLVTCEKLTRSRPYVYIVLAFFSAILTPPDVPTMMGLWLPLIGLYELGILATRLFLPKLKV